MNTQEFLDAAIAVADASGRFDHRKLSKQFKLTKAGMGVIGDGLQRMRLVTLSPSRWQLTGAARELADALHARNIDQAPKGL